MVSGFRKSLASAGLRQLGGLRHHCHAMKTRLCSGFMFRLPFVVSLLALIASRTAPVVAIRGNSIICFARGTATLLSSCPHARTAGLPVPVQMALRYSFEASNEVLRLTR